MKRRIANFFRRADEWVTGHSIENFAKQHHEGGGIEFTSKDLGSAHSNYTTKDPDGKSVHADGLLTLLGNLRTPALAMTGSFGDRIINFVSAADNLAGARAEYNYTPAGAVMEPISRKVGDTLIYIQDHNGSHLQSISKDNLKHFEYAEKNNKGTYNPNNILKRK